MKIKKTWAGWSLIAGTAVAGCSGETARPEPLPEDLPAAFVTASCQRAVACGLQPDLVTCLAVSPPPAFLAGGLASLRGGRVIYHADRMAECLTRLAAASCSISEALELGDTCVSAFEGIVPAGGPCSNTVDCRTDSCEFEGCTSACCLGSCGPAPSRNVEPGGHCTSGGDCIAGSVCGIMGTCEVLVGEGAACPAGTVCSGYLDCVGGICTPPAARGQPCDPSEGLFACDRIDDRCDSATLTCTPRGRDGEACPTDATTGMVALCIQADWCDAGTCQPLPLAGQSCASTSFCLPSLICNHSTGLCELPPPPPVCAA